MNKPKFNQQTTGLTVLTLMLAAATVNIGLALLVTMPEQLELFTHMNIYQAMQIQNLTQLAVAICQVVITILLVRSHSHLDFKQQRKILLIGMVSAVTLTSLAIVIPVALSFYL